MSDMAYKPPEAEVKVVKCRNCGTEVLVNANYPITEVETCRACPDKK